MRLPSHRKGGRARLFVLPALLLGEEEGGIMTAIDDAVEVVERESNILKNPDLLGIINGELGKKIVREEDSRKAIFLCSCGRLVKNSNLASYNLLVNSGSGAGKDCITDNSLGIWPNGVVVKRTRITENVFTYWHNPAKEPDWTWDGKVFYNEDISNSVLNSDVFKVMASSGSKATVLVKQTPVDIEIVGKPVMIVTTATANPSSEVMRRFTLLSLDEGIDQTKAIMKRQAELAETGVSCEYDRKVKEALGGLMRLNATIPYASKLLGFMPTDHIIMRTHFNRFLDYIKASAVLHQYQRETDWPNKTVPATGQDYDIARLALLKTTSNQQMIPITKNQQKLIEILRKSDDYVRFGDIERDVTFMGDRTLRRQLDKLAELGFLDKGRDDLEGSKKPVFTWKARKFVKIDIPTWEEIGVGLQ